MRCTLPHGALAGPIDHQIPETHWNGVAIIGEAPGRQEILNGSPFTGPAGVELDRLLTKVGVSRDETIIANCFRHQPSWSVTEKGRRRQNDILRFFTLDETAGNNKVPKFRGRWMHDTLSPDLRALWRMLMAKKPHTIILMGATALWGVARLDGIREHRGKLLTAEHWPDTRIVATYHTAYALHRNDPTIFDTIETDLTVAFS